MLPNHSGDATSWSFLDIFPALNSGRQLVYQGTVTQRLIVSILYVKIITGNIVSFFPGFARLHLKTLQQTSTQTYPPPAYDTFPQQDATNTYKYIDAAFISSHLPPYLHRVMRKCCCPVLDQVALQHTIQTRKTDMSWVTGWLKKGVLLVSILICRNL